MTRSILSGLLALISVGVLSVVPVACQSGGVGDPCTPEDEYQPEFPGFKVDLSNIESRSFQCTTRICLVNHFQGRVSCPLGQDGTKIQSCNPSDSPSKCTGGTSCVGSQIFAPSCGTCDGTDSNCAPTCPKAADVKNPTMYPNGVLSCSPTGGSCTCTPGTSAVINQVTYFCTKQANGTSVLQSFQCHTPGLCQVLTDPGDDSAAAHKKNCVDGAYTCDAMGKNCKCTKGAKECCIPGTDTPVNVTVCGQCGAASKRDANHAVYCSCRCCAPCCAEGTTAAQAITQGCSTDKSTCGSACDPNFNYCSCPSGYSCTNIRAFVGLGDQQLAGAYCIQAGSDYQATNGCAVDQSGFFADSSCQQ